MTGKLVTDDTSVTPKGCWEIQRKYKYRPPTRYTRRILKLKDNDPRVVMHLCDNPLCINPDHLKVGTQMDNMHDMIKKAGKPIVPLEDRKKLKDSYIPYHKEYGAASLARRYGISRMQMLRIVKGQF